MRFRKLPRISSGAHGFSNSRDFRGSSPQCGFKLMRFPAHVHSGPRDFPGPADWPTLSPRFWAHAFLASADLAHRFSAVYTLGPTGFSGVHGFPPQAHDAIIAHAISAAILSLCSSVLPKFTLFREFTQRQSRDFWGLRIFSHAIFPCAISPGATRNSLRPRLKLMRFQLQ